MPQVQQVSTVRTAHLIIPNPKLQMSQESKKKASKRKRKDKSKKKTKKEDKPRRKPKGKKQKKTKELKEETQEEKNEREAKAQSKKEANDAKKAGHFPAHYSFRVCLISVNILYHTRGHFLIRYPTPFPYFYPTRGHFLGGYKAQCVEEFEAKSGACVLTLVHAMWTWKCLYISNFRISEVCRMCLAWQDWEVPRSNQGRCWREDHRSDFCSG